MHILKGVKYCKVGFTNSTHMCSHLWFWLCM